MMRAEIPPALTWQRHPGLAVRIIPQSKGPTRAGSTFGSIISFTKSPLLFSQPTSSGPGSGCAAKLPPTKAVFDGGRQTSNSDSALENIAFPSGAHAVRKYGSIGPDF